jgi:hypothetical protein
MNKDKYSLLILLAVSCLPLTWFNGYGFISGGDFAFPLSGKQFLENTLYVWDSDIGTGTPALRQIAFLMPFSLLSWLFEVIGLNQQILERVLFYLWFSLSGISTYFLCRYLKITPLGSLGAGLFYMMNFYSMSVIWHIGGAGMIQPAYSAFPLILHLYMRMLSEGIRAKDLCLLLLGWFMLGSYMYANPAFLIVHSMPLFFYTVFHFIGSSKEKRGKMSLLLVFFVILFVCLNAFWIFPLVSDLKGEAKSTLHTSQGFISELETLKLNSARFFDLLGTRGVWDVLGEYRGVYYHSWGQTFSKPLFIILGYIITIFAFIPFLKKDISKVFLFFATLYMFTLFIIKGPNNPFGNLNMWIYENLPFINIAFRANIQKWGMCMFVAIAPLLGYSISLICRYSEEKFPKGIVYGGIVSFFIIFFAINVYPFWTDELVRVGNKNFPGAKVTIPDFYYQMKKWDEKDKENNRILSMPVTRNGSVTYQWKGLNGFSGGDFIRWFVDRPVIFINRNSIDNAIVDGIAYTDGNQATDYFKLMGMENIRYILLHNDWDWDFWKGHPWQFGFDTQKLIKFLRTLGLNEPYIKFGDLDVYKIPEEKFMHKIYADKTIYPAIIAGKVKDLYPIASSSFFSKNSTFAFIEQQIEQQDSKRLFSLIENNRPVEARDWKKVAAEKTKHLSIHNQVLFANSNFNDLVIDMAMVEGQSDSQQSGASSQEPAVRSQKPILVKLNTKGKINFNVKGDNLYDLYIDSSKLKVESLELKIQVDGKELENEKWKEGRNNRWIKVGEVGLDKGKHEISVRSQESKFRNQDKEELKKLIQGMEIVVVSKESFEKYKNIISQKPIGYLFYVDREKIEDVLKDEEKLEEIKQEGNNPFKIGKQQFYIPEDGSYSFRALIKTKRDFLMSDFVSSSSSRRRRIPLDAVSGWKINTLNTTYKQSVSEDGMHIDAYFQNKGDVKKSIILNKKFSGVNIKEKPYLVFSCEMEDPGVQKVEMDILLTEVKSQESKVRSWLSILSKPKKLILKADNKQYVINLHKKAEDVFGRGKVDNLYVKEVVLKFKKKDGVDLSGEKHKHIYSFVFKNIAFLRTQPILAGFEDRLSQYLPDTYYYFDRNGGLKSIDFIEQIPQDIKDVYKLHTQRFIDLKETPVLSLTFQKPAIVSSVDNERMRFSNKWKVVSGLDFNGDGKEDRRIESFVPSAGLVEGKLLLSVRAYEEAKRRFSNKKNYHLLSIGVSHPDDKEIFYQNVMSKKLIRYREHMYKPSDLKAGADVLQVNNKTYKLPSNNTKDNTDKWIDFSNVYFKKGEHNLNVMGSDKFKVEMVEIKPEIKSQKSEVRSEKPPKIGFKKINPTRYIVDVRRAKGPFALVFSESFHEGWKAYVRPLAVNHEPLTVNTELWSALWSAWEDRGNRIEIKDHFVVNGYANGWIVLKQFKVQDSKLKVEGNREDFQIVLEFKPQRLFEIGLIVSATTLLGCIGYLGYDWCRKKKGRTGEN